MKLLYQYHCSLLYSNVAVECAQENSCLPTLHYAIITQTLVTMYTGHQRFLKRYNSA